jgi:predicted DNA-binding WGR domain protein
MTILRAIKLFFQEGSSDKVYNATILDEGDGKYSVEVEWGRRGAKLSRGRKANKVSLAAAEKAYDKLVREKTSKGYEELTEVVQPQAVAPPEGQGSGSRATGVREKLGQAAQLLNPIEPEDVPKLLADDRVIAQQKLDGNRVLVHVGEQRSIRRPASCGCRGTCWWSTRSRTRPTRSASTTRKSAIRWPRWATPFRTRCRRWNTAGSPHSPPSR